MDNYDGGDNNNSRRNSTDKDEFDGKYGRRRSHDDSFNGPIDVR